MNLLPGGELMDLLESQGHFSESWTRFYGATVMSAFQHIHKKCIAYRDLKPENLVLDADGYCYVIDFGLAKKCEKGMTWTFCGTPDYLAPEIIRGKGHDWAVDYWAFGVLLFELTHGYAPFYAKDQTNTARNIIRGNYSIPSNFSQSLSDLIHKLLCDPSRRLGRTQGGAAAIIKHQWFSGFDWDALLDRTMKTPYAPKVGALDSLGSREYDVDSAKDSSWEPVFD
jgi:serine/threonine protein kinase